MNLFQRTLGFALLATCALQAGATLKKPHKKHAAKLSQGSQTAGPLYATRTDVMLQADAIATANTLDRDWVRHAIGQAHYMPGIAKAILPPPL